MPNNLVRPWCPLKPNGLTFSVPYRWQYRIWIWKHLWYTECQNRPREREDNIRVSILLSEHVFLVSIKWTLKCMVAAQAIDWGRVRNFGGKIGLEGHCPAASPSTSFAICMMGWTKATSKMNSTRWGRVTHICVGKLTIIGLNNDAFNWTLGNKF